MSEFKVTKDRNNQYQVELLDQICYTVSSIAFLYDFSTGAILLKHGDKESVKSYFEKVRLKTLKFPDFTQSMFIIETDQLPCEEVAMMLNCSGYLPLDFRSNIGSIGKVD